MLTVPFLQRRQFLQTTAALTAGALALRPSRAAASDTTPLASLNLIGPKEGYTPMVGTMVSMLNWMRDTVLLSVKGLKTSDLDFLIDNKANTIGAMLMHLAATETYYGLHTFEGLAWDKFPAEVDKKWETAMGLGDEARKTIKGNNLDYYLKMLNETRSKTLAELKKRDDKWLLTVDAHWPWGPTNNYCKWFHVCEHEANHNGQIKFLRKRIPGAPAEGE